MVDIRFPCGFSDFPQMIKANRAIHRMATRCTPDADSLSLAVHRSRHGQPSVIADVSSKDMRFLDDCSVFQADSGIEGSGADRRAFDFQTGSDFEDCTFIARICDHGPFAFPYWSGAAMSEQIQLALVKPNRVRTTRFPVKKRYNTVANRAMHRMATRRTLRAWSLSLPATDRATGSHR